jgi:L-threonylcarbamoyladenylate synthase
VAAIKKDKAEIISAELTESLDRAVACLRGGGVVAFPTETVYGLGADALNPVAVEKVFTAKGRPADNPLIVHIGDISAVESFVTDFPEKAKRLASHVWPGPLTIVLERNDLVPDIVAAGLDTVALRIPRHPCTLNLLKQFAGGIVGPSANTSGKPSPTTAQHVFDDLSDSIDLILDGGPTEIGLESTVLDFTIDPPVILRRGALGIEELEAVIGSVVLGAGNILNRSPGTKHRHYAPHARVFVVEEEDVKTYTRIIQTLQTKNERIGTLTHSSVLNSMTGLEGRSVTLASLDELARRLYAELRAFDMSGVTSILIEGCKETGIGLALMDRLRRASQEH